jgi:hypothetical protein
LGLCLPASVVAAVLAGAGADLTEAAKLLQSSQDEAALQLASRALDRDDVSAAQRAQLYVIVGVARFNLHDSEGAGFAFKRAFEADPAVSPKPVPPKARHLFDQARGEARPARVEAPQAEPAPSMVVAAPRCVNETPPPDPGMRRWVGLLVLTVGIAAGSIGGDLLGTAYGQRAVALAAPDALGAALDFQRSVITYDVGLALLGAGAAFAIAGVITTIWPSPKPAGLALGLSTNSVLVSGRF